MGIFPTTLSVTSVYNRNHFNFRLNQASTKYQIVYISGTVAITAEVLSNCQMQHGILIELLGR